MPKKAYLRSWVEHNRERIRAYREKTKERRNATRRNNYKQLSEAERRDLIATRTGYKRRNPWQAKAAKYCVSEERLEILHSNGCMICGAGAAGSSARMHIDHDHATNRFRGVLCESCNLGLGKFYDDPILLMAAAKYLLGHVNGH